MSSNSIELKAVIYARCSTEKEVQLNAIKTQVEELKKDCFNNKWELVDIYQENISGTLDNRPEFDRLMRDIKSNKFDIIIVKDSDRVSRNTRIWNDFIYNIDYYEKKLFISMSNQFYDTESEASSYMYAIKAVYDEYFSKNLSKKIKRSHKTRQENKLHPNITYAYGWDRIDKNTYKKNEKQAAFILQAIALYEEGKSFSFIAKELYRRGARGVFYGRERKSYGRTNGDKILNGGYISPLEWEKIITSTRLYGTVVMNKDYTDRKRKKRIENPQSEWIYFDNALEPIISKERYNNYMKRYLKDKEDSKGKIHHKTRGEHSLSSKIFCAECNNKFYMVQNVKKNGDSKGYKIWSCCNKSREPKCNNISINEENLKEQLYKEIIGLCDNIKKNREYIIKEIITELESVMKKDGVSRKLKEKEEQYNTYIKRKDSLTDKWLDGQLEDDEYNNIKKKLLEQINEAEKEMRFLQAKAEEISKMDNRILNIKNILTQDIIIEESIKDSILCYVERIEVYKDGMLKIRLNEKIITLLFSENNEFIKDKLGELLELNILYKKNDYYKNYNENKDKMVYELLKNNSHYKVKDVQRELDLGETAIRKSTARLKEAGYIMYKNLGNHEGAWIILKNFE